MIPAFMTFEFTYVGAYAIAILGLVILIGNSGQISLGHGAFVGVGGYTVAVLLQSLGLPYMLSIPIAALVCGLFGIAIGAVALRLESVYLALATFALAASVSPLLKRFKHITGGVQGISMPTAHTPQALQHVIPNETWFYYLRGELQPCCSQSRTPDCTAASGARCVDSRQRDCSDRVRCKSGVLQNARLWMDAAYAGVAGALLAVVTAYVSPDVYGIPLSLTLLRVR